MARRRSATTHPERHERRAKQDERRLGSDDEQILGNRSRRRTGDDKRHG
jgi:hypothetical protein